MTESEWLECTDPTPMLDVVLRVNANNRKVRLFACAYARKLWTQFDDERSKQAVEVAEEYADGEAHEQDRERAWQRADTVVVDAVANQDFVRAAIVVYAKRCLAKPMDQVVRLPFHFHTWVLVDVVIVKDIFGNPFRTVSIVPAWLIPTVTTLAQAAYEERILPSGQLDPARLAVLSDALEEAGCDIPDILTHLRGPGPHVRGCWVLDLLLGKE